MNLFFLSYLLSPRFCHRFVGYLEEEAVKTYTKCLEVRREDSSREIYSEILFHKDLDAGKLPMWSHMPSPLIAKTYWNLADDATMRDVIYAIRADEAHHRVVNHTLGSMHEDEKNPYSPGVRKL